MQFQNNITKNTFIPLIMQNESIIMAETETKDKYPYGIVE